MLETIELASDRYTITEARGTRRFLGHDHRLGRDVLIWVVPVADDAQREWILSLARDCARLTHPVFLQTLDLMHGRDHVAIVLEAPSSGEPTAEHPLAGGLPALIAATLTLRIGAALEEAAHHDLVPSALPLRYVHVSGADEVRLDPIGLFGDSEAEASVLVPLLTEFLACFLPGGERAGAARTRFDPGAQAALSFVGRWEERGARGNAGDVEAFLDELRRLARAPADSYVEEDAAFRRDSVSVVVGPANPDEEMTVPLELAQVARPGMPAGAVRIGGPPRGPSSPRYEMTAAVPRRRQASPSSQLLTVVGFGLIAASVVLVLVVLGQRLTAGDSSDGAGAVDVASPASTPPAAAPAGRATLSITARQDAQVLISVDGNVAYSGRLKANETRSWEGSSRVQVWTNNGKNLDVTVNGHALGALSPAVGHPDWNTVDWGWDAGWKP